MPTPYTVCFVTVDEEAAAASLAKGLVKGKFAACVTVLRGAESTYRWQGRIETAREALLLIKTRRTLIEDVQQFIREHHPAKTPEVIFLDIADGSPAYLDWIGANTLFTSNIPKDKTSSWLKEPTE